jgi:hypothetical protein
MHKFLQRFVFFLIVLAVTQVQAEVVKDLSVGVVAVTAHSTDAVNQAAPAALKQVLIKMTGNPSVVDQPELKAVTKNAAQWMQSFSYLSVPSALNGAKQARITFDRKAVVQLLQKTQQAVWRADRPLTLLWVKVETDDNNPNPVLSSDDQSPAALALQQGGVQLGLPLVLPSMDLHDQNLTSDDAGVLPFNVNQLKQAGRRYHAQSILAGNLSIAVDGSWQGQWMYLLDGVPHQWDTLGATSVDVIQQAMTNMASILASEVAARDNAQLQSTVSLKITGVTSLSDYAAILHNLKQLKVVAQVSVAQLDGSTVYLQLRIVGGPAALQSALKSLIDLTLVSVPTKTDDPASPVPMVYQFNAPTAGDAASDSDEEGV